MYKTIENKFSVLEQSSASHEGKPYFAGFDDSNKLGRWIELRYLKVGDEIAAPDYETGLIKRENIQIKNQ